MPDYVKARGVDLAAHPEIDMREYIFNMPELMAAADLFITRAGASTLNEIMAAGTPCIIVPSPNVTDNHQEKNARVLERGGGAVVLREADCDGEVLYNEAKRLLADQSARDRMRSNLSNMAVVDSAERILQTIFELSRNN